MAQNSIGIKFTIEEERRALLQRADELYASAQAQKKLNQYGNAKLLLEKAMYIYENNIYIKKNKSKIIQCLSKLANIHELLEEYESAKTCLEQALNIYTDTINGETCCIEEALLDDLARIYNYLKQYELARDTLNRALMIHAKNTHHASCCNKVTFLYNLAHVFVSLRYFTEAKKKLNEVIAISAENESFMIQLLCNLADVCLGLKEYEEAKTSLIKALEICQTRPDDTEVYNKKRLSDKLAVVDQFLSIPMEVAPTTAPSSPTRYGFHIQPSQETASTNASAALPKSMKRKR